MSLDNEKLTKDFEVAFDKISDFHFDKFKFDVPDYEMLILTEENYFEMMKSHSALLAYYGSLKNESLRNHEELERAYKYRMNLLYTDATSDLAKSGKKHLVRDVEAHMYQKNEDLIKDLEKQLQDSKATCDNLNSFYEGIKSLGFAIGYMTSLITSGIIEVKTTISEDDVRGAEQRKEMLANLRRNTT